MAHRLWSAIVVLACAASANANSPEPSRETLAFAAAGCTATGGFQYRFGEHVADKRKLVFAPFAIETVSSDQRDGLFEITAAASFAHAPMSQEDRRFLADWVFHKLATGIGARKFVRRQDRRDGIAFIADTFVVDLSHEATTVRITCTDIARRKRAREILRLSP